MSAPKTDSSSGPPTRSTPLKWEPMILRRAVSPTNRKTGRVGQSSPKFSANGVPNKCLVPAEVLEQAKPPPPRVLTVTNEEFQAWKQILSQFRNQVVRNLNYTDSN